MMSPEQWRQVEALYHAALERPVAQRSEFIAAACGADTTLRSELESLLAQDTAAGSPLDRPAWEHPLVPLSGTILSRYELLGRLGAGGMGVVYKARDTRLHRIVALKFLTEAHTREPEALKRFEREARAASALNHPNICTVYDIGEHDNRPFLILEFLEGETLQDRIQRGPLTIDEILDFGIQISDSLDAAHQKGIIHRDIKPANIFLTARGGVKVLDFGVAKLYGAEDRDRLSNAFTATNSGCILGTAAYMSPEQARGEELDARTDLFSLGAVLYEMAIGRPSFPGGTVPMVFDALLHRDPAPVDEIAPHLPARLSEIVSRALEKNREYRYRNALAILSALKDLKRDLQSGQYQPGAAALPKGIPLSTEARTFVGREREITRLTQHFERMLGGAGTLVFLSGEAGIGKSTLAEEFIRSVRATHPEVMIATGRSVEQYGIRESYLPFLEALSALLRNQSDFPSALLRAHAPTWCLHLPAFSSGSDLDQMRRETAGATKHRMLREMGDALSALSSRAPLLLLLEDLHWADPSTVDLLRYLCQRIPAERVLLLATLRPEDVQIGNYPLKNCKVELQAHRQCDEILLDLLSLEDITKFINLRFSPNGFPAELAGLIRERTDGQALFTASLLDFLRERGDIVNANSNWTLTKPLSELDLEIPDNVRAMIRSKSEALDADCRLLLQYASVLGEEFLSTIIANLLDSDELKVEEQLATVAQAHRLIEMRGEEELPDGVSATRYAFAHALYQNVFYEELVSKRRALLHARAGEKLLLHYGDHAPRIAAQLAMHFERGRNWTRAIEFLISAGANARSMYANTQAEEHYTHALRLAVKLPVGTRAETEFRIHKERAAVYLATSRFDPSIADCKDMIDRAHTIGSQTLQYAALYTLGNTLFWAHRLHEMQSVLEDVLRLAERTQSEAARLQAVALMAQGRLALGDLDDAEGEVTEVIERSSLVDKQTLLGVLDVRARLAYFRSEYCNAEKMFTETLSLASELGSAFELLTSNYFLSLTLANLGRISEAFQVLHRGMQMADRNGNFYWAAKVPNAFGWMHRELQDFEGAAVFDRQGAEMAHRLGVVEAEANSAINLAADQLNARDRDGMFSAMKSAESIISRDVWFRWRFEIRFEAARAEQTLSPPDAIRLLEKATQHGARKYMIAARTLLARIAMSQQDATTAKAELKAASAILKEYPAPLAAWKTYSILGRVHAQLGEHDAARAAFREATSLIGYVANHVSDERLRGIFLNSAAVQEVVLSARESGVDSPCAR
jgi:serine/threonine protein kinase